MTVSELLRSAAFTMPPAESETPHEGQHTPNFMTGADKVPAWVAQIASTVSSIRRESTTKDCNWRENPGEPILRLAVSSCSVLTLEMLVLHADGYVLWLRMQHQSSIPAKMIHPRLAAASRTRLSLHLAELLRSPGCRINLYDPIVLCEGTLIVTHFTLSIDGD